MKKNTLNKLSKYTLGAVATLATVNTDAAIIYNNIADEYIDETGYFEIDIDLDGQLDFAFIGQTQSTGNWNFVRGFGSLSLTSSSIYVGGSNNQFIGYTSGLAYASNLSFGQNISVSASFVNDGGFNDVFIASSFSGNSYAFGNSTNAYLGFKFDISGQTHYGWMKVNTTSGAGASITILDYAYEACPNTPITAGAISSGSFTSNPVGTIACEDELISFTSVFSGTADSTVWQSSDDGINWFNIDFDQNSNTIEGTASGDFYIRNVAYSCGSIFTTSNSAFNSITPSTFSTQDIDAPCASYTSPSGKNWTSDATYMDTITNAAGCDSVMTINLTLNNGASGSFVTHPQSNNICSDQFLTYESTFSGTTDSTVWQYSNDNGSSWINVGFDQNSNTLDAYVNGNILLRNSAYACGSIFATSSVAIVSASDPTASTQNITQCSSYISPSGKLWTTSNTYMDTIQNAAGCDSIMTFNLTISGATSNATDVVSECGSYTWRDGNIYSSNNNSATYLETGVAAGGCDSLYTLNLTIKTPETLTETVSACNSYTWRNGVTYNSSNSTATYTVGGVATNGCDSIYTLNLSLGADETSTQTVVSCGDYTWAANGTTYSTAGMYTVNLMNQSGCDSVVTLDLSIDTYAQASIDVEGCESVTVFGNSYTSSTTVSDTLIGSSSQGCDSITIANVIVHPADASTQTIITCNNYTWPANGVTYNSTGTHTATLMNANNCDSVVTLDLTIGSFAQANIDVTGCDAVTVFGNSYTSSQVVNDTIIDGAGAGCDSITVANITVNQSTSSTLNEAINSNETYFFGGNSLNTSGTYTSTVTNAAGCDSNITLNLTVLPNSIGEINSNFKLYPNPTKGMLVIESDIQLYGIRLIDTKGSVLIDRKLNSIKETINLNDLDTGIYFYELIDREGNVSRGKIIKDK